MIPFTIYQLELLQALFEEKNFTKAANSVNLSQPSLSKQLKKLEKNLNVLLIYRKSNKFFFTKSGKLLLNYGERILEMCKETCRVLTELKNGERKTVIVGASKTIGAYILPNLLTTFQDEHADIRLKVKIARTSLIAQEVSNGKIDIALVGGQVPRKIAHNLNSLKVAEDELHLMVAKTNVLAKKKIFTKEDLYSFDFIVMDSDSSVQELITASLIQYQVNPERLKIVAEVNDLETLINFVSLGRGAAFISSITIKNESISNALQILTLEKIRIVRPVNLIKHKNMADEEVIQNMYQKFQVIE
jgi:DNA-binding transcriptional LysR family regulator